MRSCRDSLSSSCDPGRTEELLAATGLFNDLNQAGLKLLDRRNVVGEDTHFSGLGGHVDLDNILGLVDGLLRELALLHQTNFRLF